MPVFLLACVVSFVPSVSLFLLLRNRLKEEDAYKKLCSQTLWQGAKCTLPVILLSGCSYIILRLTGLHNTNPLLYQALYKFIVLALMEEAAKYWGFKRILKKTDYAYSWLDTAHSYWRSAIWASLLREKVTVFSRVISMVREVKPVNRSQSGQAFCFRG